MELTWNAIKEVTVFPLSNKSILQELGVSFDKYQQVAALTRIMVEAGELQAIPDPNAKRGYLFKRTGLNVKSSRSDEQVAADTNTGVKRKKRGQRGISAKYRNELDALMSLADTLIRKHGYCTTDMLRGRSTLKVPSNLWGAVFTLKRYKSCGRVRSSIKSNNGRYICKWRLT